MENRTVDNLFAGLYGTTWPGHGTWGNQLNLRNPAVAPTLTPVPLNAHFDPSHKHDVGWAFESKGLWNDEPLGCRTAMCPAGATAYAFVPPSETAAYQFLIKNWAFASNVLQANEGPSFVAHQYYIAAQSGGLPGATTAPDAEAENPRPVTDPAESPGNYVESAYDEDGDTAGCNTGTTENVKTINMSLTPPPQSPIPSAMPSPDLDNGRLFSPPCEEYKNTILDEIESEGNPPYYDWQYIALSDHTIWAAPLGVKHLYDQYQTGDKPTQPFAVDPDAENFVLNITGNPSANPVRPFASLTYITPCADESDHPIMAGNADGPEWLAWVINAIGESQYWNSTAIIVTWDDWGGWFDGALGEPPVLRHPLQNRYNNSVDPNEWGFRVPLMVISPYVTGRGYISNATTSPVQWRSQSAIMQFIESNFGLSSLNGDDSQQNPGDGLHDMFSGQTPLPYVPVPTPSPFIPGIPGTCPTETNGPSYRKPIRHVPRRSLQAPQKRATLVPY